MQNLSKAIGRTLSSYTKGINIQNKTTGNLFHKKTKAKLIDENIALVHGFKRSDYLAACLLYSSESFTGKPHNQVSGLELFFMARLCRLKKWNAV